MRSIAPLAAATCLACNGHLDLFELDGGTPEDAMTSAPPDSGYGVSIIPADILFVVDNSGSMADEQENLAINFASFVDQVAGYADYRIGVVTTDLTNDHEQSGYVSFTFSSTYPNVLTSYNAECGSTGFDHACFRGPDPSSRVITSDFTREEQIRIFGQNIRVGTCGTGTERGLDGLLRALQYTAPGGCNEGFLRPDANLVIVLVSDEDEASTRPIQEIVDELGQYKPFGQVRVATVVGSVGGESSNCSIGPSAACGSLCQNPLPPGSHQSCSRNDDCPSGEVCLSQACENQDLQYWAACYSCAFYNTPDCCSAVAGSRYIEFARAVEQRVHAARQEFPIANCVGLGTRAACLADTICQESFGDTLARIARELVLIDL